jgi:diacylglycerol kinase family enzyme
VPGPVHLDGEPHWMEEKLQLQLLPRSLKILTAKESLVI